jgi:hypothetical protein
MFSCTTAQHIYCTNCSVQLNCTYSNYTEAAATCSAPQHIYSTNWTVCNWTILTVITQKLPLHVLLHNSTAHLLYIYCTVCKWTVLTIITQKLLLDVQLHKRTERVQLLSSEVQCGRLFEIVCVYRQSYPDIRSFKEIQMTKNALPQPPNATKHSLNFLLGDSKAAFVTNWWDDFIQECGVTRWSVMAWSGETQAINSRWSVGYKHTLSPPVWHSTTAESAFLCHLPSTTHSHWAIPSTVTQ